MCNYSSKLFFNTPVNFTCHLHKMNISGWVAMHTASHTYFLWYLHIFELTVEHIMQDTPYQSEQKDRQFWKLSQSPYSLWRNLSIPEARGQRQALQYVDLKSAALSRKVIAHQKPTMPYSSYSTLEKWPWITSLLVQDAKHQCCSDY